MTTKKKNLYFFLLEFELKVETVKWLRDACSDAAPASRIDRPKLENSYLDTRIFQAIKNSRPASDTQPENGTQAEEQALLRHLGNSARIMLEELEGLFADVLANLVEENKNNWAVYKARIAPVSNQINGCPGSDDMYKIINRVKNTISEIEERDPPPSDQDLLDGFYWYRYEDKNGWFSKHLTALSSSVELKLLLRKAKKAKQIFDNEQQKKDEEDRLKKRRFLIRVSIAVTFGILGLVAAYIFRSGI